MILQEKIQKEAEGNGQLAPAFLEGAKFALANQWISVEEDLPCNHEELLITPLITKSVIVMSKMGTLAMDRMSINSEGNWRLNSHIAYWMPIPQLPEEQEFLIIQTKEQ